MSEICDFGHIVYKMVNRFGWAEIAMEEIERVYGTQLHHHPMYFPLPGMPAPCSTLEDFKKWATVQGFGVMQPPDKYDKVIVTKRRNNEIP